MGSLLNTVKKDKSALNDAKKLKEKIEAGYKGNPSSDQAERPPPITRTIINIPDSILQEYRSNQKQQYTENKKNRYVAIAAVFGAWIMRLSLFFSGAR